MDHQRVMDRSHVLGLGGHVINVLHGCSVVKNADLTKQEQRDVILKDEAKERHTV